MRYTPFVRTVQYYALRMSLNIFVYMIPVGCPRITYCLYIVYVSTLRTWLLYCDYCVCIHYGCIHCMVWKGVHIWTVIGVYPANNFLLCVISVTLTRIDTRTARTLPDMCMHCRHQIVQPGNITTFNLFIYVLNNSWLVIVFLERCTCSYHK